MATENIKIKYEVDKKQLEASNKALKDTISKNNLTQKEVAETTNKFKSQEKQLAKTNKSFSGLSGQLTSLGNRFRIAGVGAGDMATNMLKTTKATGAASKALRIFKIALISTGIGAIVVALGSLVAAFSSTQKGIDKINKLLAPLKGAFQAVIGVAQDLALNIFAQLKDRFTVASNAIQIGLGKIRILWNKVTNDSEEANEIIEKNKQLTAESEAAHERLNKKAKEFSDILKGANDRIKEGIETQKKIEDLTIAIARKQIDTAEAIAKSRLEYEKQRAIAQDQNKTDQERVEALNKAEEAQRFIAATEKEILNLKIQKLEASQSLNDTDREGELELAQLKVQAFQADQEAQRKINGLVSLRSGILKRQAEEAIKAAEEQLKFQAAAEKRQEEIRLDTEERIRNKIATGQAILFQEELNRLRDQSASRLEIRFAEIDEQERLEKEKVKQSIADEQVRQRTIALIERKYADEKIALKQEEEDAKLALTADAFGKFANIAGRNSAAGKAAAVAQATINTYQGATKALAELPPPFSFIMAALTVAQGIKSVQRIIAVQPPKFEKGGRIGGKHHSQGGTIIEAEKDEFVMSRKATAKYGFQLMDKINNLELKEPTLLDGPASVNIIDSKPIADQLKNMPQNVINIDGQGFELYQKRGFHAMSRKVQRYSA